MKNTMLWGALFAVICTPIHADTTQQANPSQASTTQGTTPVEKTTVLPIVQSQSAPAINCDYKITAQTKQIDQALVITWSEKAIVQAFEFDPATIENQMQRLKACFTEQGWTSFDTAIQKSGNIEAIKTQNLTVSSQVDGQVQVNEAKDNQWKLTLPLQVVYQNDKEKVTQLLNINLIVGRKITGDLGIMQMIAAPRTVVTQQPSATLPTQVNSTSTPPEIDKTKTMKPTDTNTTTPTSTTTPTDANTTTPTDTSTTTTTPAGTSTTVTPSGTTTTTPTTGTTTTTTPTGTTTTTPTGTTTTTPAGTTTTTPTDPTGTTTTTPAGTTTPTDATTTTTPAANTGTTTPDSNTTKH